MRPFISSAIVFVSGALVFLWVGVPSPSAGEITAEDASAKKAVNGTPSCRQLIRWAEFRRFTPSIAAGNSKCIQLKNLLESAARVCMGGRTVNILRSLDCRVGRLADMYVGTVAEKQFLRQMENMNLNQKVSNMRLNQRFLYDGLFVPGGKVGPEDLNYSFTEQ